MSAPGGALTAEARNRIAGAERPAAAGEWFEKVDPATGRFLCRAARSCAEDVGRAVDAALAAQPAWGGTPGVERGLVLHRVVRALQDRRGEIARAVAAETGKSLREALGEADGAAALGLFFAGECQRLYGRTTTSGAAHRWVMTLRRPVGVAGLIVAANTPIANVAWKAFPALACGNAAVLKAAEDAPATALLFARIAEEAGLPPGVLNVVQGLGAEAGAALAAHPAVGVVSFTGSTAAGRLVQEAAGPRLARVSLELGGKNPFVVCDDADLDEAARWAALSAFSNAGQRCAAGSRIIVLDAVHDAFRERLLARVARLRVGPEDGDDLGPVISARALGRMLAAIGEAVGRGAAVAAGGRRLDDPARRDGFYLEPTLLERVPPGDALSTTELFGPVAALYRAPDFAAALRLANESPYGLTACVHTRSVHRALAFAEGVRAGVAVVNAGTFGSEPHLPFGGLGASGNGTREPGTEALDVYADLKNVLLNFDPGAA